MVDLSELRAGVSLAGEYTLEQWLRNDGEAGFFAASLADGERALVKLVRERAADAQRHFASWQRARHLRHKHLLDLRDVGRTEVADEPCLYAVFEYPESPAPFVARAILFVFARQSLTKLVMLGDPSGRRKRSSNSCLSSRLLAVGS
jgi:hypothetical protein